MTPNISSANEDAIEEPPIVTERTPLLRNDIDASIKHAENASTSTSEGGVTPAPAPITVSANLRIVLPALMVCAFLAAFDVTVVAAIYPIMHLSYTTFVH
jgi:hypothetical protein